MRWLGGRSCLEAWPASTAGIRGEQCDAAAGVTCPHYQWIESNAWCPRLTATMILSGSATHWKGFDWAL
jgi:hypothetical protein